MTIVYEIYKRSRVKHGGNIFWRAKKNGKIIADSAEGYHNKMDVLKMVMELINHPNGAPAVNDLVHLEERKAKKKKK